MVPRRQRPAGSCYGVEFVRQFGTFFGLAFSALLPLINPVGAALVFLGLVGDAPPDVYRTLARKIAINTTLFMIVIQLIGTAMRQVLRRLLPVMQVSGGLVLAAMGWGLLKDDAPQAKSKPAATGSSDVRLLEQKVFYPFTFPLTAGPGSIVVMVTLSAHASVGGVLSAAGAHAGIVAAVMLLSAAVYIRYGRAAGHYGSRTSRDRTRHPTRDRVRVAVHRRPDNVERVGHPVEGEIAFRTLTTTVKIRSAPLHRGVAEVEDGFDKKEKRRLDHFSEAR